MTRILTALQPSGILHIGNYFGAIEPFVASQKGNENFLFIVDYHAITVPQKPEELHKNILFAAAAYLACGVDPRTTVLFQQSRVAEQTELAWILNCVARMGELERMTQYKEKAAKASMAAKAAGASIGLFDYPVLMAADILLYDTNIVPVGEDQKQHVELARDLALRFNRDFGETFVVPEPRIRSVGARLMGLDDPTKKMSKSAASAKNFISLLDDEATIRKKIKSAVTDPGKEIAYDETNKPAISNLLQIFSLVTHRDVKDLEMEYKTHGYATFKDALAEAIVLFLLPLQAAIKTYLAQEDELKKILNAGAERAQTMAERKMKQVRERIGVSL